MDEKNRYLDWPTREFLRKLGKGSHVPGSGSAAALQGMIAAQLLQTVIAITSDDKHKGGYHDVLSELLLIRDRLSTEILPSLEESFQKDAELFDNVIELRRQRNEEKDPRKLSTLQEQSLEALRPATDILLDIGNKCADIADFGVIVFEKGFKSARGDSGVALNGAVAALAGCMSVIDLNLSYFGSDSWTIGVRQKVAVLRKDLEILAAEAARRMEEFRDQSQTKSFAKAVSNITIYKEGGVRLSKEMIESLADRAVDLISDFRERLWKSNTPTRVHELLRPEVVLQNVLGYQVSNESLGTYDDGFGPYHVAATLNIGTKVVRVSPDTNMEERNFTLAHELGHVLMHGDIKVLHRDRPLSGTREGEKDVREIEADKFASCFLMPSREVKDFFYEVFLTERFEINDLNVFRVSSLTTAQFRLRYSQLRYLSRFLTAHKRGDFQPLHRIFGVSVEAMARRLEELDLVRL